MVKSGSLLVLVAIVLVAAAVSGSDAVSKVFECCKTVTNKRIIESILGYRVQKKALPCVTAVILQTQSGHFCVDGRAPWVRAKIAAFERAKSKSRV